MNGHKVHILGNLGSAHNFIDTYIIQKLGYKISKGPALIVVVADSNEIKCKQMCAGLLWRMQGQEFQTNFLVILLENYQMV